MWDKISPAAPFYFSAAIALLTAVLLLIYTRFIKSSPAQQA